MFLCFGKEICCGFLAEVFAVLKKINFVKNEDILPRCVYAVFKQYDGVLHKGWFKFWVLQSANAAWTIFKVWVSVCGFSQWIAADIGNLF